MKKIQIDSISQDKTQYGVKTTFMSGKDKYSFYDTKKDGGHTKAFEQFNRFGFKVGDVVSAEVREEEKSFVNEKGKNVTYTQRTIIFFEEIENTPMVTRGASPTENRALTSAGVTIERLVKRVKRLEDKVFADEVVEDDDYDLQGASIDSGEIPF